MSLVRRRAGFAAALALALALGATAAHAGTFDDQGGYHFDPEAVFTEDFEDPPPPSDAGGPIFKADENALSGQTVLSTDAYQGTGFPMSLPKIPATYRVSMWVHDTEALGDVTVSYSDRTDEFTSLYPTGRITSDGWIELASEHVRVDGARATATSVNVFSIGGATFDAIEVVPVGDLSDLPVPPNKSCAGVADAKACGPGQVCMWGLCRNLGGWVPDIPQDRDAVAEYLGGRLELLFGPYYERTNDLPDSLVAIQQMKSATDPWTYWNGFLLAIRRLHDGHTTTFGLAGYVVPNPRPFTACFVEGDGDLTHDVAPKDAFYRDVLVSHAAGDHNLGLKAGDRLVAVDGMHPLAWARSLVDVNWDQPGISNHETYAELATSLRGMISRYAGSIQVVRCDGPAGPCGAVETLAISELPYDPMGTEVANVSCDNRPLRHVPGAPIDHATGETVYGGIVNESDATEKIYGLEWESLYVAPGSAVGPALSDAVKQWKAGARGVILDHRTGYGGTIQGPQILWNFPIKGHKLDVYQDRQRDLDEEPTLAEGQAWFTDNLGDTAGTGSPVTDVPVALLTTEDVSASDWLPLGLKGGGPKVRIFGPYQTNGGFSTRYTFGYWLSMSYVIAVGDTFLADGSTLNGHGVEPDQIVLPLQSDLYAGKDTVYDAALAWVRQELKP